MVSVINLLYNVLDMMYYMGGYLFEKTHLIALF